MNNKAGSKFSHSKSHHGALRDGYITLFTSGQSSPKDVWSYALVKLVLVEIAVYHKVLKKSWSDAIDSYSFCEVVDGERPRVPPPHMDEPHAQWIPVVDDDDLLVGIVILDDMIVHLAGESTHVPAQLTMSPVSFRFGPQCVSH